MASQFARVTTSLGEETLKLASMTGTEALGRPFKFELDLYSSEGDVKLPSLLGEPVTVELELQDGEVRYLNGVATRFACTGSSGRHTLYRATLRPWFWLMTRAVDCRIFQHKTVPDVIKEVFRTYGFSDFDELLSRGFREWEYIVQYRESAFNFVSRLMEQEGIYYYFKHQNGKHVLFMTDFYSGHLPGPGYEEIPFFPPYSGEMRETEHVDAWRVAQEIQPGKFTLDSFDFKKPKADLLSVLNAPDNKSEFEVYDYPGEYEETADGEVYARMRTEQATSEYELVDGHTNARGLCVGNHFILQGHPRKDQNREYLVTSATFTLDVGDYESADAGGRGPTYRSSFQALETNTPYRPARETPKPLITGPQTAIVTGKAGDEIHTDKYGRVKVKFHWDRGEAKDETSSCWVRVAQIWAGARWGAMHIPRVGQEVIVEFLEGDPDQPIVTGRVYNSDNMPPYDLPGNKTQSGLKSRSTLGGNMNHFNELRFEDKKGEEQVYLHAERNMDTMIENDETLTVGGNRTKKVKKDEHNEITQNRHDIVVLDETIEIGQNRKETVTGTETIDVVGTRTEHVIGFETVTLDSGRYTEITGIDEKMVKGNVSTTVTGAALETITGPLTQTVTGGITITTPATVMITATAGITQGHRAKRQIISIT
jgi:type VI secretion system secreted protein VgrG